MNWRFVDLWDFLFVLLHLNKLYFTVVLKKRKKKKKKVLMSAAENDTVYDHGVHKVSLQFTDNGFVS